MKRILASLFIIAMRVVPATAADDGRLNVLVEFVDIYPSLAEIAGLPLPSHLEGTSFKPLLNNLDRPWKTAAFSQFPRKVGKKNLMGYTMRTDRYRYTKWVDRKNHDKVDAVELYDHQTDPQENKNIAGNPENKKIVAQIDAQWQAGWKSAGPK